jgi:hypothetical protein
METIDIALLVLTEIVVLFLGWWVSALSSKVEAMSKAFTEHEEIVNELIAKPRRQIDELDRRLHEVDLRTSRIAEDRGKIPIAGRASFTKFVQPMRDEADRAPIKPL